MTGENMRWLPASAFFSFLIWVIVAADSGAPNYFLQLAAATPYGDKMGHVLLFGALALLLNFATKAQQVAIGPLRLYLGVVLTLGFALLEEVSQLLFPSRSFELLDILADLLGVTLATILTTTFYRLRTHYRQRRNRLVLQQTDDDTSAG